MWRALLVTLGLVLFVAACGTDGTEVAFSVRSDLRPGVEFDRVQTALFDGEVAFGFARTFERDVTRGEDFITGRPVAEFPAVPEGPNVAQIRLLLAGVVVLARNVRLDVRGPLGVTVVMSRACIDTICPSAESSPTDTECVAGRCVPPTCTVESPESCGAPSCMGDEDCIASATCATSLCADGSCLTTPDDTLCAEGEVCDLVTGCSSPPASSCTTCGVDGTCAEACEGACECPVGCDCAFTCDGSCRIACEGEGTRCQVTAAEADVVCRQAICDIQLETGSVDCRGTGTICTVTGGDLGIACDRATCNLDLGSGTIDCVRGAICAGRCSDGSGWTTCFGSECCWEGAGCGGGICGGPESCSQTTSDGTPVQRCGAACPTVEPGCFPSAP